jgi:ubiquinone biosynthesis monooxygenase Coq7
MHMPDLDSLIIEFDKALRTVCGNPAGERPSPGLAIPAAELSGDEKSRVAALMRVNHCGEICAQALYQGQALVARTRSTRNVLLQAAQEERDHLAWCQQRLDDLGGRKSVLNPLWYAGSFGLGVASGMLGDRWSMAFLVETERQVERHLDDHLSRLPGSDVRSRKVLEAMRDDEIRHGASGEKHGAAPMPQTLKLAMRIVSRLMTRTAYWF